MQDVVAHLPSEFALDGNDVARWLIDRLAAALRDEALGSAIGVALAQAVALHSRTSIHRLAQQVAGLDRTRLLAEGHRSRP